MLLEGPVPHKGETIDSVLTEKGDGSFLDALALDVDDLRWYRHDGGTPAIRWGEAVLRAGLAYYRTAVKSGYRSMACQGVTRPSDIMLYARSLSVWKIGQGLTQTQRSQKRWTSILVVQSRESFTWR
jgi:hypothetical protein